MPKDDTTHLAERALSLSVGTEFTGDLQAVLEGSHSAQIRDTLLRRGVILFRDALLSRQQHMEFARLLGNVMGDIVPMSLDPEVSVSGNDYLKASVFWHMDLVSSDTPNFAVVLNAERIPETGGQTQFANTRIAWEELPEERRRQIEGLQAWHSVEMGQLAHTPEPSVALLRQWQAREPVLHPLVWTHANGDKSLVLSATASHIEGMDMKESRMLLCELREWATQERFVYRHDWQVGDLLVWDNTRTVHRVTMYEGKERLMWRATIEAEEPLA